MAAKRALTYRDYEVLPNDRRRYEIHDGELCVTPAPSLEHQIISARLSFQLMKWVEAHPGGLLLYAPLDVILADRPEETSIVQPDIVYIAADRIPLTSTRGLEGAPTVAIEILSPSTRAIDRGENVRLYARYGVPYVWLVDSETRLIQAFVLEHDRYVVRATANGAEHVDLPPFIGLALVPDALWP